MRGSIFTAAFGLVFGLALLNPAFAQSSGGTWETRAPMPTARQELATAALNGKVYVIGGYNSAGESTDLVEVYNPATDTWTSAHPIPAPVNHGAAAVAAGKLYSLTGGSANVYNPETDSWAPVASMHFNHGGTPAVGVISDKIYVAGGLSNTSLRDLEVYDPSTNIWTVLASMSVARNHTGGAVIDGKFYVVGGRSSLINSRDTLEVYDPGTDSWSNRAPMPTARSGIGVAAVNGEMFVFGGELPGLRGEVEAYNPISDTWRSLPDMPSSRHGIWASVIGDKVYLPGGGSAAEDILPTSTNQIFTVDRPATFANISTRLNVQRDDNVLIGGFIITGATSKRALLRAVGPSLPSSGQLADPVLELHGSAGQLITANDNWEDAPNEEGIIDSALAPTDELEAAILTTLDPGSYTAIVRGAENATGVGLVEVYDLEAGSDSKPANISTRGLVQTGDDVLIGGLILTGSDSIDVIVRAIGPSLALTGVLADPSLELFDANGARLAFNDNWRSSQETEIIATGFAPQNDLESAILRTLSPAAYTAIVRGVGETSGVALVEAYDLE